MSDPNAQPDGSQSPYPGPGQPYDSANPYPTPYGGYPQAPGGYGFQQPVGRNGMAIAALTLGIIGIITSIFFVGGALGIVGLILGIVSLRTSKRTGVGRGMAIGGIVTSAVAIVAAAALLILTVWVLNKAQNCTQYSSDNTQYTQCIRQQITGDN